MKGIKLCTKALLMGVFAGFCALVQMNDGSVLDQLRTVVRSIE